MFCKVFIVCALACVAAAYEDVQIPTFDTTKLGVYRPYMGLTKDYIMQKEMMDLPYYQQNWWTKYSTPMMNYYKQDIPYDVNMMMKMPYYPYEMQQQMYYTHPLLHKMYNTGYDLPKEHMNMMMMMPYYQRMMMQNYMMY